MDEVVAQTVVHMLLTSPSALRLHAQAFSCVAAWQFGDEVVVELNCADVPQTRSIEVPPNSPESLKGFKIARQNLALFKPRIKAVQVIFRLGSSTYQRGRTETPVSFKNAKQPRRHSPAGIWAVPPPRYAWAEVAGCLRLDGAGSAVLAEIGASFSDADIV
ncbi:hypothetical protein HK405_009449 [Cladochytrium tenue]|nr:hypothetical protein HK405_009449 [Cladochytrium tenue]